MSIAICGHGIYKQGNMWAWYLQAMQYASIFVAMWAWYLQALQYMSIFVAM